MISIRLVPLLLAFAVASLDAASPAEALASLSPDVLDDAGRRAAATMIERDLRHRQDAANQRNRAEWAGIQSREQWEAYREPRLARLKASLGQWPRPPAPLESRVAGSIDGAGFVIENLVYQSRPGNWVTGNLYRPAEPKDSMPGILISHAHHWGKDQGELQDMGMTWARAGCTVLVIDQVGYGERRNHPFDGPDDYAGNYRVGRQDYYFRYDSGLQLQLVGDSLMGWMVWDLMRGVDLLLQRPGIDPKRIIMLGAVAGGGDPCGITTALDPRVAAAVPFNFGGPQPETRYPLPDDAEVSFNYLMGSYWDSTRGLRRTAADGFFHWVITSSIAPRRLIHAHEFSWDGERDPVWKRYRRIWGEFYNAPERLAVAHGKGLLSGSSPEASHCGQIGRYHRRMIHPSFQRWFGIEVNEDDEFRARREADELICLTPAARAELAPKSLTELVTEVGEARVHAARTELAKRSPTEHRQWLRERWRPLLGEIAPTAPPTLLASTVTSSGHPDIKIERVVLEEEPEIVVPLIVLRPEDLKETAPVVLGIAQAGKSGFLANRSTELAALVRAGAVVCLPDLRGTGETRAGNSRGRTSGDTNRSVNLQLHGETMLGQRLRDLHSVLAWLRSSHPESEVALWGESFATVNPPGTNFQVPRGIDGPTQSEPLGGLLALLGALFNENLSSVFIHGGLSSYQSMLGYPRVYLPHDDVVPGALTAGDLCDLAAALAPAPLCLDGLVDGLNRHLSDESIRADYRPVLQSYKSAGAAGHLTIARGTSPAQWIIEHGK